MYNKITFFDKKRWIRDSILQTVNPISVVVMALRIVSFSFLTFYSSNCTIKHPHKAAVSKKCHKERIIKHDRSNVSEGEHSVARFNGRKKIWMLRVKNVRIIKRMM